MIKRSIIKRGVIFLISMGILSCTLTSNNTEMKDDLTDLSVATFGAGCFWCVEAIFESIKGVEKVVSGYSGGTVVNPSYEAVCTGQTGHAEVCQIYFDSLQISFEDLLEVYWQTHNPTTLNKQGGDVGTQYRSVIFYHNENQKELAAAYKNALNKAGVWDSPIVTQINSFEHFYPADEYHQDYYQFNKENNSYCSMVITPKLEKFKKVFSRHLKP